MTENQWMLILFGHAVAGGAAALVAKGWNKRSSHPDDRVVRRWGLGVGLWPLTVLLWALVWTVKAVDHCFDAVGGALHDYVTERAIRKRLRWNEQQRVEQLRAQAEKERRMFLQSHGRRDGAA